MKSQKELAQEIEEARLGSLDEKEKIIRENSQDLLIEEGQRIISTPAPIQLPNRNTVEQVLASQGLLSSQKTNKISSKAKRSKRYYIRKRMQEGKPYIPQRIRALGKQKAKELGYNDWERREFKSEEVVIAQAEETLTKLGAVTRLIIRTRLGAYFERLKNGNL